MNSLYFVQKEIAMVVKRWLCDKIKLKMASEGEVMKLPLYFIILVYHLTISAEN